MTPVIFGSSVPSNIEEEHVSRRPRGAMLLAAWEFQISLVGVKSDQFHLSCRHQTLGYWQYLVHMFGYLKKYGFLQVLRGHPRAVSASGSVRVEFIVCRCVRLQQSSNAGFQATVCMCESVYMFVTGGLLSPLPNGSRPETDRPGSTVPCLFPRVQTGLHNTLFIGKGSGQTPFIFLRLVMWSVCTPFFLAEEYSANFTLA